jgi:protein phosphatase
MKVRVAFRTDVGRSRARNEDSYLVQDPLFAVADGMGGHRGGDVASSLALDSLKPPEDGPPAQDFRRLVEQVKEANQRVLERGESDRDLRGMGTTLTAILTTDGKAHVAHVGDSRAYMLRDGKLQQLTEDHTLVQRMVREGRLTEDEAHTHPQRSVLTRALGVEENVAIDELTLDLKEGDRLLLCSDGLTSMIDKDAIQEILAGEPDPQIAADRLIDEANRAGGDDNITVVILDVVSDQDASAAEAGSSARFSAVEAEAQGATHTTGAATAGPAPANAPPLARRRRRGFNVKRALAWGAAVAVIALAGMIATRFYVDRQWYVGDAEGRVAIYNGIPAQILGFKLSHIQETTDLPAVDAERLAFWRGLQDGITAGSFEEAQSIVERIRQDLQTLAGPASGGG